jgi:hypothetical protein
MVRNWRASKLTVGHPGPVHVVTDHLTASQASVGKPTVPTRQSTRYLPIL